MAIQYTASGGINVFGCGRIRQSNYYLYKYGENSIVFLRYKAVRGNLEKIAIKKVIVKKESIKTSGLIIPLYVDTLNAYYNEEELCSHKEAVDLAKIYYESVKAAALRIAINC